MKTHFQSTCLAFSSALLSIATIAWLTAASSVAARTIGPDAFGYRATNNQFSNYVGLNTTTDAIPSPELDNAIDASTNNPIALGFNFNFYGTQYSHAHLNTKGFITFASLNNEWNNVNLATSNRLQPTIAPLWDDWLTNRNAEDRVLYQTKGNFPNRTFTVEWSGIYAYGSPSTPGNPVTFQVVLHETTDQIDFNYYDVHSAPGYTTAGDPYGGGATVGIANSNGATSGNNLQWTYNEAVIGPGRSISFYPPGSSPPAEPKPAYSFTNVADITNPAFVNFGTPSISNGVVAFQVETAGGGRAIYKGNEAGVALAIDNTSPLNSFSNPVINAAGRIAFRAETDLGEYGVFTVDGGGLHTIADGSGAFSGAADGFGSDVNINVGGTVSFYAKLDNGREGIFKSQGGAPTAVAIETDAASGPFKAFNDSHDLNDDGTVIFRADRHSGSRAIFTGNGGPTTLVAEISGPVYQYVGGEPLINNNGVKVIRGTLDNGTDGLFFDQAGSAVTIADHSGQFESILDRAINDAGTVAFCSTLDNASGHGIFTGADPLNDCVIRTGDELFGSIVTDVQWFRALDEWGNISFKYTLASGVQGIAIASPLPSADFNNDGLVDGTDLALWKANVGNPTPLSGDADGNGNVDGADFLAWQRQFTGPASAPSQSPIPEPTAISLALSVALACLPRRGRMRVLIRSLWCNREYGSHDDLLNSTYPASSRLIFDADDLHCLEC